MSNDVFKNKTSYYTYNYSTKNVTTSIGTNIIFILIIQKYHLINATIILNINTNISETITLSIGNHNGLVTHHQDQSILSVSLRTKNMINTIILKLIPFDFIILFILFITYPSIIFDKQIHQDKQGYQVCFPFSEYYSKRT